MTVYLVLAVLVAVAAYVRLAPSDPARWHVDLVKDRPADMAAAPLPPGADLIRPLRGGAYADLAMPRDQAQALLATLDGVAMGSPRTTRLSGSVAAGRVTWVTRSRLWGFPDYTTAEVTPAGLTVYARLRFGASDAGVNAARLRDWLSRL